jgi:hypothetical protein
MHRPVAAVSGVAHLAPSVGPLTHTKETKASSSAQRTVPVPVTTRKACTGAASPFGPGGPAAPGGPAGPASPFGPGGPAAPGGPAGPASPFGPGGPAAPGGPAGPCGPCVGWPHPATRSVMMMAEIFNSCCIRQRPQDQVTVCVRQLNTVKKPKLFQSVWRASLKLNLGKTSSEVAQCSCRLKFPVHAKKFPVLP